MSESRFKALLMTARPSFLILTPACILLGISTSLYQEAPLNFFLISLIMISAVSAHVSVNMLNEYFDFKSGLDLQTVKTAFSGGSGALPSQPSMANATFIVGLSFLLITIAIGFYLLIAKGRFILPIGLIGVVLVLTYTQWVNRNALVCLVAPGLGFGILMVVGTHAVLAGAYSTLVWQLSIVPFLLINNLLLLNQYPDINADAIAGRKTLPIVYGIKISNIVYLLFTFVSYGLIIYYVLKGFTPSFTLIALVPIVFSLYAGIGALKYGANIGKHPQYLAMNVIAAVLTPLLVAIAILLR